MKLAPFVQQWLGLSFVRSVLAPIVAVGLFADVVKRSLHLALFRRLLPMGQASSDSSALAAGETVLHVSCSQDEPASRALELSTPRANVQNLRNLFSEDKCAPATGSRPPSLKKPNAAATPVRIPRPSLAPKPANKPGGPTDSWEAPVAKDPPAVIPCLPRVGAVSAKRASLERISAAIAQQAAIVHQAAIAQQAAELRSLRGEVASPPDKTSPEVTNNGGCKEPVCVSDEEDYETPIALSSQQPARRASPVPPPTSPPEDPKVKAKPRLPEPPAYVPQQLVRGPSPLVNKRPCWRRWPLPPTTLPAPPKPTRPPGMTCPLSSPLQSRNGTPPSGGCSLAVSVLATATCLAILNGLFPVPIVG